MHVMRNFARILGALALMAGAVHADDTLKAAQETLKAEGFYLGEVDGNPGSDTTAALRRYQIRNGLGVTGELDAATASALGLAARSAPAGPSAAQPGSIPPAPVRPSAPAAPASRQPPGPIAPGGAIEDRRALSAPGLVELFRETPYSTAPAFVRVDVLRSAQAFLRAHGVYDGDIDGIPGLGTTRALVEFQRRHGLVQTGRLDMDTLARMNLLPRVISRPRYGPPARVIPPPMRLPPRRAPGYW
jgi:peptidoglycan hydrolase-like protein with peptidoglycan-binding domain